jgi:stalled ribosome rescue protein Dom34
VARSRLSSRRAHSDVGQSGSGHSRDDVEFYDQVALLIGDVREVLVIGPGLAKTAFERYIRDHHPLLADHIVGVETVDHPTTGQMLQYAKKYFLRADQMLGDADRPHSAQTL